MSQAIKENIGTVGIVAVVLVLLGIGASLFWPSSPPRRDLRWYYDLSLDKVFVESASRQPPFESPYGSGSAVRLHVLGCGSCRASKRYPVYLSRLTEEYKRITQLPEEEFREARHEKGRDFVTVEVRPLRGDEWVPKGNETAVQLVKEAHDKCPHTAEPCWPRHRLDLGGTDF
jgi:hypothetical protein